MAKKYSRSPTSSKIFGNGNRGKADVVAISWQQVFTRAARKEEENRQISLNVSRFQVSGRKS